MTFSMISIVLLKICYGDALEADPPRPLTPADSLSDCPQKLRVASAVTRAQE